jgi:hypothetical protein
VIQRSLIDARSKTAFLVTRLSCTRPTHSIQNSTVPLLVLRRRAAVQGEDEHVAAPRLAADPVDQAPDDSGDERMDFSMPHQWLSTQGGFTTRTGPHAPSVGPGPQARVHDEHVEGHAAASDGEQGGRADAAGAPLALENVHGRESVGAPAEGALVAQLQPGLGLVAPEDKEPVARRHGLEGPQDPGVHVEAPGAAVV